MTPRHILRSVAPACDAMKTDRFPIVESVSQHGIDQIDALHCQTTGMGAPVCPMARCLGEMQQTTSRENAGYDATNGLLYFHCPACGHIGMIAAGGVQLVFRLAHRYVLTYEPYCTTITILLPAGSVAMCHSYRLDAETLARHAAEWALLSGNRCHTLALAPDQQKFLEFTCYLDSLAWSQLSQRPQPLLEKDGQADNVRINV